MRLSKSLAISLGLLLFTLSLPGFAASYMAVDAVDAQVERAVRCDWTDNGIRWFGAFGGEELQIGVTETSTESIDTCWIYVDGTTTIGTTRDFTPVDFRLHHGIAIIKYSDSTYESIEFRIKPSWPENTAVTTSVAAPNTNSTLILDTTANSLINAVVAGDKDGPAEATHFNVCDGESGCCYMVDDGPDECVTDWDCF